MISWAFWHLFYPNRQKNELAPPEKRIRADPCWKCYNFEGEGGTPPPTSSPLSVATLPRNWSLRSLAKIAPKMFWLITPLGAPPPPDALTHGTPLPGNIVSSCKLLFMQMIIFPHVRFWPIVDMFFWRLLRLICNKNHFCCNLVSVRPQFFRKLTGLCNVVIKSSRVKGCSSRVDKRSSHKSSRVSRRSSHESSRVIFYHARVKSSRVNRNFESSRVESMQCAKSSRVESTWIFVVKYSFNTCTCDCRA